MTIASLPPQNHVKAIRAIVWRLAGIYRNSRLHFEEIEKHLNALEAALKERGM